MQVYERRPNGLSVAQLTAQARRAPGVAAFAAARGVVGIVLIGLLALPLGPLWALIGIALLASVFLFVRAAADGAVQRPALVLTGRPKWDGTRRTSWTIDADDAVDLARRLADALDEELGDSLTAFDEDGAHRGATRNEVFAADAGPAVIAWGTRSRPRLAASEDVDGVWLRIDRSDEAVATVMLLANDGRGVDALRTAAWRT